MAKKIACKTDPSNHGGTIITHEQDETLLIGDISVFGDTAFGTGVFGAAIPALDGSSHSCPIEGHGTTDITAVTIKSLHNSELLLTENAIAGCGALIVPPNRNVNVE